MGVVFHHCRSAVRDQARHGGSVRVGAGIPARLQSAPAVLGLDMRPVVFAFSAHPMGLCAAEQHERGYRPVGRLDADRQLRRGPKAHGGLGAAAAHAALHVLRLQIRREHDIPVDLAVEPALLHAVPAPPQGRRCRCFRRLRRPRHAVKILCPDPGRDLLPRRSPASFAMEILCVCVALCLRAHRGGSLRAAYLVAADPSGAAAALPRQHFGLGLGLRGGSRDENLVWRAGNGFRGRSRRRAGELVLAARRTRRVRPRHARPDISGARDADLGAAGSDGRERLGGAYDEHSGNDDWNLPAPAAPDGGSRRRAGSRSALADQRPAGRGGDARSPGVVAGDRAGAHLSVIRCHESHAASGGGDRGDEALARSDVAAAFLCRGLRLVRERDSVLQPGPAARLRAFRLLPESLGVAGRACETGAAVGVRQQRHRLPDRHRQVRDAADDTNRAIFGPCVLGSCRQDGAFRRDGHSAASSADPTPGT